MHKKLNCFKIYLFVQIQLRLSLSPLSLGPLQRRAALMLGVFLKSLELIFKDKLFFETQIDSFYFVIFKKSNQLKMIDLIRYLNKTVISNTTPPVSLSTLVKTPADAGRSAVLEYFEILENNCL